MRSVTGSPCSVARLSLALIAVAMFGACGGLQPPIATPEGQSQIGPARESRGRADSVQYEVQATFNGDGAVPYGALISYGRELYGTSFNTGGGSTPAGGTIFVAFTSARGHGIFHKFGYGGSYMGPSHPIGGIINAGHTFYGTTWSGGAYGLGTVFSITTAETLNVLHSFRGQDGSRPYAALLDVKGELYGTTAGGGKAGAGTLFEISKSGKKYRVLHSFGFGKNGCAHDGCFPYANLINVNGTLYGTTSAGGVGAAPMGTVFSITASGAGYTVVHTFCPSGPTGCTDGTSPQAGLLNLDGTLYGTTLTGGSNCQQQAGCGTVFSIGAGGTEGVVYSFCAMGLPKCSDGEFSYSPLTAMNGTLYGMTYLGGDFNGQIYNRYYGGTVFSLTTSGTETVLHSFGGNEYDGDEPVWSGLTNVGGTLYGTTIAGGNGPCYNGCGTVFGITP